MAEAFDDGAAPSDTRTLAFERIVFFTDAVFAISITLLVLEVRLPDLGRDAGNGQVARALLDLAPQLFGYLLSFAVIGLYWLAHWRRFEDVVAVDQGLARINLLLLACVALIPFPTAVLGSHGDTFAAVALYAVVLSAAGFAGSWTWSYARRHHLTRSIHSTRWLRLQSVRAFSAPAVLMAGVPLALLSPTAAEVAWLLIFPVQALTVRAQRRTT